MYATISKDNETGAKVIAALYLTRYEAREKARDMNRFIKVMYADPSCHVDLTYYVREVKSSAAELYDALIADGKMTD